MRVCNLLTCSLFPGFVAIRMIMLTVSAVPVIWSRERLQERIETGRMAKLSPVGGTGVDLNRGLPEQILG
jgi:hypothetical protein